MESLSDNIFSSRDFLADPYFDASPHERQLYARFFHELEAMTELVSLEADPTTEDIALLLAAKQQLQAYYHGQFEALRDKVDEAMVLASLKYIT